nr:Plx12 [Streptomyces sp.]
MHPSSVTARPLKSRVPRAAHNIRSGTQARATFTPDLATLPRPDPPLVLFASTPANQSSSSSRHRMCGLKLHADIVFWLPASLGAAQKRSIYDRWRLTSIGPSLGLLSLWAMMLSST